MLWGSQTVSQLGTAMTDYAVIIWVYSQRGTASSVTLLTVCTFLPTIFSVSWREVWWTGRIKKGSC